MNFRFVYSIAASRNARYATIMYVNTTAVSAVAMMPAGEMPFRYTRNRSYEYLRSAAETGCETEVSVAEHIDLIGTCIPLSARNAHTFCGDITPARINKKNLACSR